MLGGIVVYVLYTICVEIAITGGKVVFMKRKKTTSGGDGFSMSVGDEKDILAVFFGRLELLSNCFYVLFTFFLFFAVLIEATNIRLISVHCCRIVSSL